MPENLDAPTTESTSFTIEGRSIVPTTTTLSRKKTEISDILTWIEECVNSYISVITACQPERIRDLLAYMALIMRMAKHFPGRCWYSYDCAFRLEAAASNSKNWSQIKSDLYLYHTSVAVKHQPQAARSSEPRGDPHSMIFCKSWNTGACSSPRDTIAIETGAAERTAESTAQSSHESGGEALAMTQAAGDSRNELRRDGVGNKHVFSCVNVARTFNLPDVSVVSPINVAKLALQLYNHPDRSKVEYILNGFRHGFRLGFHSNTITLKSAKKNCPSFAEAAEHPIDKYLAKEVSLGGVAGPSQAPVLSSLHINRFGVIPKKDGGWHLILDLSFPFGHSVNDGINKEDFTVTYSKVSDAIALIVKAGRGVLMGKVDIKRAW